MMRMLIKGFTKGTKGSHYLIADVGTADTLKDIGVHSKRVPKFVSPDSHIQHGVTTQELQPCKKERKKSYAVKRHNGNLATAQ